jgi:hypothetical protein
MDSGSELARERQCEAVTIIVIDPWTETVVT